MNNADSEIAKIEKVVVGSGVGRLPQTTNFEEKILPNILEEMGALTGQKPGTRTAKKSIAGFKIRQGNLVGLIVTLRASRKSAFIKKLIAITLPRIRDFRGISKKSIDKNGNLTIGIKEHIVFPEITTESAKTNFGMQITLVPKKRQAKHAAELYKNIGIPFEK